MSGTPAPPRGRPPRLRWRWDLRLPDGSMAAGQRTFATVAEALRWRQDRPDLRQDPRLDLVCLWEEGEDGPEPPAT